MSSMSSYDCARCLPAGAVTVPAFMVITAPGHSVVCMTPCFLTCFHGTYLHTAACAVAVPALMCIAAIAYPVMHMLFRLPAVLYRTDLNNRAGSVAVPLFVVKTAVCDIIMHMPPRPCTVRIVADLTQMIRVCTAACLAAVMAMCRNRHYK